MGLIGVALIALIIITIIRQRRARQLDREIAAAAAGANFNDAAFEDNDFERHNSGGGVSSSYYPTSTGTHGTYGQPPMEMQQQGQWDPYATQQQQRQPSYGVGDVISGAPAAYGLGMPNRERRTSTGTGTSAGMAGFGARGAGGGGVGAGYPPYSDGQDHLSNSGGHEQYYGNTGAGGGATGYAGAHPGDYYDPYTHSVIPGGAAGGAGAGAVGGAAAYNHHAQNQAGYGQHHDDGEDYPEDHDAYGGEEEYEPQPVQPAYLHSGHRQDSSGTYKDDDEPPRTLKVANE